MLGYFFDYFGYIGMVLVEGMECWEVVRVAWC